MVVVVATVLILLTVVLPAAARMWNERRAAEAQNTISGMLMTARAKAMQSAGGESGLLFFVDGEGVQRVASITQDPNVVHDETWCVTGPGGEQDCSNPSWRMEPAWENVFTVSAERHFTMPPPMRAAPRYAVDESTMTQTLTSWQEYSDEELGNDDFNSLATGGDQAQRHRNFFAMVFSNNGELRVRRDVLIRDVDVDAEENPGGDVTGLRVSRATTPARDYYRFDNTRTPIPALRAVLDASGRWQTYCKPVDFVVTDDSNTAINFPSVDGLLVYDDSLFKSAGGAAQRRQYLLDSAQPFFVHRQSGTVVRGPVAESTAATP